MPFPSLPLEILQQIAGCVETVHRPSLFTFSLTSKVCHRASKFLIFRQINITVHNREGLRHDANRLVEALFRTDSARHVQCINIKGDIRTNVKKDDSHLDLKRATGLDEILVDFDPTDYSRHYVVYDEPVIKRSSEEDMAWVPIISLVQAIPHLRDLVYDCQSQFPPSLLSTLYEEHPQCRLHHLSFRFRTLLWGVPYPYEMELATSPLLYKANLICSWQDSDWDDDFNEEAIMELAARLAPNLKEVTIIYIFSYRHSRGYRVRESWQGLPGFTSEAVGSLKSLSIKGCSHHQSLRLLQNWARHTDFACLQHLVIAGGNDARETAALNGETMEWVAQNHFFPQVRTLSVNLSRNDTEIERPHYSENAVSFFRAFAALQKLSVNGPIDAQIMDAILSRHGQTLTKLNLCPLEDNLYFGRDRQDIPMEFTHDRVLQIQAQCPVLEELAIPVKRDKSSASEVKMYRCFTGMRSLRSLFLILDCSNWRVTRDSTYNPQFDGYDQKIIDDCRAPLKRGVVKETLINCAVDEALARSIWKIVSQDKMGRQLERFRLWTTGGGYYGGGQGVEGIHTIVKNLSRSWLIERMPRDDQEDITVRELGQHAREFHHLNGDIYVRRSHNSEAGQVFRSIWPRKQGSRDWRDDWSSFPLQV